MAPRKPTTKTAREQEMELELAKMQTQLATILAMGGGKTVVSGKALVGIRNVSSYTLGMVNTIQGEQGEIQLHPAHFVKPDPESTAIVSHQFWTTIRKGKMVANGQLIRDDSLVSDQSLIGPADRPEDLPAGFAKNLVVDPFEWIDSRDEQQIREDVATMTSEPSLRRLAAAVDWKIWTIGEEKYKHDEDRAKFAIRDCPAKYRFLDTLVEERIEEINPVAKDRASERNTIANFRG